MSQKNSKQPSDAFGGTQQGQQKNQSKQAAGKGNSGATGKSQGEGNN